MNKVVVLLLVLLAHQQLSAQLEAVNLKCEYMEEPMGVDMTDPRFYWQLFADEEGQLQKAYRLIVSSSPEVFFTLAPV